MCYFLLTSMVSYFYLVAFYLFILLLFNYSCLHFSHFSPLPYPLNLPHSIPPLPLLSLKKNFIVTQLQLYAFSPHPSTPVVLVHGSFTHVPWWPFPFFVLLSPSPLPSGYYLFFIYMSLVIFCSLVCFVVYVPLMWDHMVFVFYLLAYFT